MLSLKNMVNSNSTTVVTDSSHTRTSFEALNREDFQFLMMIDDQIRINLH